jgi:hypothetical protein
LSATTIYRAEQRDTTECRAWVEVDGHRRRLWLYEYDQKSGRYRRVPDVDQFAYGYGGTGPHNLARAIVAHALGPQRINRPDGNLLVNELVWSLIARSPANEPLAIPLARVMALDETLALEGAPP